MWKNIYETQRLVEEYLLFHYGMAADVMGEVSGPESALGFPQRVASYFEDRAGGRALDIGSGVGRASYCMAVECDEVISMDYSQAFMKAAIQLRDQGEVRVSRLVEGRVREGRTLYRPEEGDPAVINFQQGDAMDLPQSLGMFDNVLAANLICRLPEPNRFLDRLSTLVKPQGRLVLATPCTWLEEFTPPENFPKGSTLEWLKGQLSGAFELKKEADEPFLIRETARKFQWTVSQVTVWDRKS